METNRVQINKIKRYKKLLEQQIPQEITRLFKLLPWYCPALTNTAPEQMAQQVIQFFELQQGTPREKDRVTTITITELEDKLVMGFIEFTCPVCSTPNIWAKSPKNSTIICLSCDTELKTRVQ